MNKKQLYTISEITDSVEMLHEKPNKGMPVFTWILVLLIVIAIIWCSIGSIDYYVKATGSVRPGENISTVSTLVSGRIKDINISEGDMVQKGDLLFTIDKSELEQSILAFQKEKERLELDNSNLDKLNKCVENKENLFNANSDEELSYYLKYEKYIADLKGISENYQNTSIDTEKSTDTVGINVESMKTQLSGLREDLADLKTLRSSIEKSQNLFIDKNSIYALQYSEYESTLKSYEKAYTTKKDNYINAKAVYEVGGISQSEYDSICREMESAETEKNKYKDDYILNIQKEIANTDDKISNLEYDLQSQNHSYSAYSKISHDEELALENARLEFLQSISDTKKSNEVSIASLDKQISEIKINMDNAEVCSPINGVVNMYSQVNESDIVQSGQTIATIVPNTDGEYKLTMYLSSSDISEVEVGQTVRLRFAAYPYQEYGEFEGTVKNISTDARANENIGSYYVSEVTINDTKGLQLISGMECEARVVTKQRKIIYWILEKLDFIND